MKIWNIAALCVLATASTVSSLSENAIDVGDAKEEFLDDCPKFEEVKDTSIKFLMTTADVVNSCSKSIIRVLDRSNGHVFIMGADKGAVALACVTLNNHKELFFNKIENDDFPEAVKSLRDSISGVALDIKAYTTSQQTIIAKLRTKIIYRKYDEAVELTKYLYKVHSKDGTGKTIITKVINQILRENISGEIMNYAYILHKYDTNIVKDCFPKAFSRIFNQEQVKIFNKEKKSILRLTEEKDSIEHRWLYSDCIIFDSDSSEQDVYWKFTPVWSSTLQGVKFTIQNPVYGMKLKVDANTLTRFSDERLVWGDHSEPNDPFWWRLMPVGLDGSNQPLFRLDSVAYGSCWSVGACVADKVDIRSSKRACTSANGWNIE